MTEAESGMSQEEPSGSSQNQPEHKTEHAAPGEQRPRASRSQQLRWIALAIDLLVALPIVLNAVGAIVPLAFLQQYRWLVLLAAIVCAVPVVTAEVRARQRDADQERSHAVPVLTALVNEVRRRWAAERSDRKLNQADLMDVHWRVLNTEVTSRLDVHSGLIPIEVLDIPPEGECTLDKVLKLYRSIPTGQLIILGAPGSGKSALALRLTLELVGEDPDVPSAVPVMVSLSGWDPKDQDLKSWFETRVGRDYGSGNKDGALARLIRSLIEHDRIIAVLDGLDEMEDSQRERAISRIDDAAKAGMPLILTCRIEDYTKTVAASNEFIKTALAIELEPVKPDDAILYLRQQTRQGDKRWQGVIETIATDRTTPAKVALSKPLMLWLATEVFKSPKNKPSELLLKKFKKPEDIEARLLDGYLEVQYPDERPPRGSNRRYYPATQARPWLEFLAYHLHHQESLTGSNLNWWLLAKELQVRQRILAGIAIGLVMGSIGGFLFAISNPAAFSFALTCSLSVAVGISIGIKGVPTTCAQVIIGTRGSFRWNWQRLGGGLLLGVIANLGLGLAGYTALGTFFLVLGLLLGVILMLADTPDIVHAASPTSLFTNDRIAFLAYLGAGTVMGLAGGVFVTIIDVHFPAWLAGALAGALTGGLMGEHVKGLTGAIVGAAGLAGIDASTGLLTRQPISGSIGMVFGGLIFGISCALASALASTSYGWFLIFRLEAVSRHVLPFRTMRFLEDAHDRMVLRQAGGSYQFTHASMQRRLLITGAQAPTKPGQLSSKTRPQI